MFNNRVSCAGVWSSALFEFPCSFGLCLCAHISSGLCPCSPLQGVNSQSYLAICEKKTNVCVFVCDFPCTLCTYQFVHRVHFLLPLRKHIICRFWGFRWGHFQHSFPVKCLCIQVPRMYLLKGTKTFERSLCDRWHPHANTNSHMMRLWTS